METEVYWTKELSSKYFDAIEDNNFEYIRSLFDDKPLINVPMYTTGEFAGYTPLHMAFMSMIRSHRLIELLVEDFHADVNVIAKDGVQPIHLACICCGYRENPSVNILLKAGADANAEISVELFHKYINDKNWSEDFGDKITLLTYLIIYGKNDSIAKSFINNNANPKIKSEKNKTLLMYAIENDLYYTVLEIIQKVQDRDFINARDDGGYSALHYLFLPEKHSKHQTYSFDGKFLSIIEVTSVINIMHHLLRADADVHLIVNDDPNTLLLNVAAFYNFQEILCRLLTRYVDISKSRALYHVTRPLPPHLMIEAYVIQQNNCICLILEDLIRRRTFGLPILEEETKLMDKLTATNSKIKDIVFKAEQAIVQNDLKIKVLNYGDKTITCYDFIASCFDDKKLRLIVKDKSLIDAFKNSFPREYNYMLYRNIISKRIEKALRVELYDRLKRVENLRKALPLPFEIVIMIVEYFDNQNYEKFIDSFYL